MEPTIGRIVHFHADNGETHAAIIVAIFPSAVNLACFHPWGDTYPRSSVIEGTAKGQWSWPPIVKAPVAPAEPAT